MDLPARARRAATSVGTKVFMIRYVSRNGEYSEYGRRSCLKGGRTRRTERTMCDDGERRAGSATSGYRANYTSRHCQRTRHARAYGPPVTGRLLPSSQVEADPPVQAVTVTPAASNHHQTVLSFFPNRKPGNNNYGG